MIDALEDRRYTASVDAFFDALRNADSILAEMRESAPELAGLRFEIHEHGCPTWHRTDSCNCVIRTADYVPNG